MWWLKHIQPGCIQMPDVKMYRRTYKFDPFSTHALHIGGFSRSSELIMVHMNDEVNLGSLCHMKRTSSLK